MKSRVSNAKTRQRGKSVVHNKPEYADVQCYDENFTDFIHESLSYLQNCPDS